MADVANYCTVDAKLCQELMVKLNIINDKREIMNLSHTTLYDAIYFADSMKVRNIVITEPQKLNLTVPTSCTTFNGNEKYPKHLYSHQSKCLVRPKLSSCVNVMRPMEDIKIMEDAIYEGKTPETKYIDYYNNFIKEETQYPVSGLDFSSLYPSIIMTYNMSPEYIVYNREPECNGHTLHKIDFDYGDEKVVAYSIRHDTIDGVNLLLNKSKNKFGLYPTILKNLFDRRSNMKKNMKTNASLKERLELDKKQDSEEYKLVSFNTITLIQNKSL